MSRVGWILPDDYENSEYAGLNLQDSDNFPALAFRINYTNHKRKAKVGDDDFSFTQLFIDQDERGNFCYEEEGGDMKCDAIGMLIQEVIKD